MDTNIHSMLIIKWLLDDGQILRFRINEDASFLEVIYNSQQMGFIIHSSWTFIKSKIIAILPSVSYYFWRESLLWHVAYSNYFQNSITNKDQFENIVITAPILKLIIVILKIISINIFCFFCNKLKIMIKVCPYCLPITKITIFLIKY